MTIRIKRKAAKYIFLIALFPICRTINWGLFNYYDELIGICSFIYVLNMYVSNRLEKIDRRMMNILFAITIIGFLSNIIIITVSNVFAILIDALWLYKTFSCYITFKYIASDYEIQKGIVEFLSPVCKFVILFITALSVLNIFANIGVSSTNMVVFGFRQYTFIWSNTIQTGWLMFCCLCIISLYETPKIFRRYIYISCIPAIFTFSALVYCWFFVAIFITLFFKNGKIVRTWHIIFMALGVILLTFADIKTYILGESVRSDFWRAAIMLATKYFPLGTGFASFGSEMASRYYSSVYINLGWENTWALGRNGVFLNDNFFASILGQFGWIGLFLYLALLASMFCYANKYSPTKETRTTSVASVLTICAVMIGSASAKSLMGCCMFSVLGVMAGVNNIHTKTLGRNSH